jgi:hypothetical protein
MPVRLAAGKLTHRLRAKLVGGNATCAFMSNWSPTMMVRPQAPRSEMTLNVRGDALVTDADEQQSTIGAMECPPSEEVVRDLPHPRARGCLSLWSLPTWT